MPSWLLVLTLAGSMTNPWSTLQQAAPGQPEAIGAYNAGCLQGARRLPETGIGYQVLRPAQHRYYGHASLIQYVLDLGHRSNKAGLPDLLVGDLAMVRGGPFSTGHRSHQTGLDGDIWFRFAYRPLSSGERNQLPPLDLVNHKANRIDPNIFSPQHLKLLRLAASDPKVERIFVNPAIKLAACQWAEAGENRTWLAKLRPWFGHSAHFHVRLRCPADSADCQPQTAIPAGDGCGTELLSWLEHPPKESSAPPTTTAPHLPARCERLLTEHSTDSFSASEEKPSRSRLSAWQSF